MEYVYKTSNVCSREIHFNIDGNIVTNVVFYGGCNGNTLKLYQSLLTV